MKTSSFNKRPTVPRRTLVPTTPRTLPSPRIPNTVGATVLSVREPTTLERQPSDTTSPSYSGAAWTYVNRVEPTDHWFNLTSGASSLGTSTGAVTQYETAQPSNQFVYTATSADLSFGFADTYAVASRSTAMQLSTVTQEQLSDA